MNIADIILLVLKLSIMVQVFALGLKSDFADILYLPRRPKQLLRSLLAMNFIMPVFAAALVLMFAMRAPVEIMLIAVALSPVPPLLPGKQIKAGGRESYAVSLLCVAAFAAIFTIPLLLEVIDIFAPAPLQMSPLAVAQIVITTLFLPLGAGMAVRAFAPKLAERFAPSLLAIAAAVLPVAVLGIVVASWSAIMAQLGDGTLLAIAVFIAVGLAVGHVLGGPDPADRTVLSLSTASRHPGLAAAIASANFPEVRAAMAVLLLYLIVGAVVSAVYLRLRKAHAAKAAAPHASAH